MISRKISGIGTPEKYVDRNPIPGALTVAAYYIWRVPKNGIIKRIDLDLESSTGAAPVVEILGLNAAVLATITINDSSNTQKSVDTNISVGVTDRILVSVTTAGTASNLRVAFVFQET
jgi:hypothetical protein